MLTNYFTLSRHLFHRNMALTSVLGNLCMRIQISRRAVPLNAVPERRTKRCSPRLGPGDRFCELSLRYLFPEETFISRFRRNILFKVQSRYSSHVMFHTVTCWCMHAKWRHLRMRICWANKKLCRPRPNEFYFILFHLFQLQASSYWYMNTPFIVDHSKKRSWQQNPKQFAR